MRGGGGGGLIPKFTMQWKLILLKAGPIAGNATTLSCLTPQKRQTTTICFSKKKDGKKSGLFTLFLTDDVGPILVEKILIYIQILFIYHNMSTVNNKTMIITLVFLLLSSYHLLALFLFSSLRRSEYQE